MVVEKSSFKIVAADVLVQFSLSLRSLVWNCACGCPRAVVSDAENSFLEIVAADVLVQRRREVFFRNCGC